MQDNDDFSNIEVDKPINYEQPINNIQQVTPNLDSPIPVKKKRYIVAKLLFAVLMLLCFVLGAAIVWYFIFDGNVNLLKNLFR